MSKHLFYVTSDQLYAYLWRRGRLSGGTVFGNDGAGIDAFLDYLDGHGEIPAYLLADLIEEDFQRTHAPHVGGRAGRKLLQRRLLQQYRETPFRHVQVQGREAGGRHDDIVLLSALTNPAAALPWVEAMEQVKTPLAGLYSTTLLSTALVRELGLGDEHLLIVTQQSAGWRQSYFHHGALKFSRLTPAIDRDGAPVDIGAETSRTQQFLTSVRLIGRGNVLHPVVIAPDAAMPMLERQCEDGPETAFRFVGLPSLEAQLGLRLEDGAPAGRASRLAEPMLLGLLARLAPASHYPLGAARRYFYLWRIRVALYAGSAALTAASVLWAGANLWQQQQANAAGASLNAEAGLYAQRYRGVMASIPPRVTNTANMRAAVEVERMLALQAPSPRDLMLILSRELDRSPDIRLLRIDWKVDAPAAEAAAQGETEAAPITSLMAGIPVKPLQSLLLEAEIVAAADDYRTAVDAMNRFARQLARQPRLSVGIDRPPLDTRSTVKLNGKAGPSAIEAPATFALNLTWKP